MKFGWEKLDDIVADPGFPDLVREHWEDLARDDEGPPRPDWDLYVDLERRGLYRVWTARDGKALAGYIAWFIQKHPHSRELVAVTDALILAGAYRQTGKGLVSTGTRMWVACLAALRKLGVERALWHSVVDFEADRGGQAKLYQRLGARHTHNIWALRLKE